MKGWVKTMSKILFIDVDGTLTDYQGNIPNSTIYAIRKARELGHRVYICTGRSRAEVYANIWEIGLDGIIGGNGSYVEDHGHVIFHHTLSAEDEKHIVNWLHEHNLEFFVESNAGLFASENFESVALPAIIEYSTRKDHPDATHMTVRKAFPEMIFDGGLYRDDVNKISYVLSSYQDHLNAIQEFPHLKNGTWGGAGETALFGDIGVQNIDKARSIQTLLDYLNETFENTIAFGDAKIDIPMFKLCAHSVCMKSGGPEAKAAAEYVSDDVERDGLYKGFVHLGLIEDDLHLI